MFGTRLRWTVIFFITFNVAKAFAADSLSINLDQYKLRMDFIESRLEQSAKSSRYWQNGWTTFYAATALAQTALWIEADNNDDRVNYSIGALKSAGGLVDMLLRPHPGRYGAQHLQSLPQETPEQQRARLARGETLLKSSAERSASRRTWQPHFKVLGVNAIAGALIAAFGDEGDALTSTVLGVAIGEANIWTLPTRPEADWHDYQQQFPLTQGSISTGWSLVPIAGGLALQARF